MRWICGSEDKLDKGTRPTLDEALISAVVDRFYARARIDPLLGPICTRFICDAAWRSHLEPISGFWCSLLLGTRRHNARFMPKHLAIGGLDNKYFVRWLSLFRETVEPRCEPTVSALFANLGGAHRAQLSSRDRLSSEGRTQHPYCR